MPSAAVRDEGALQMRPAPRGYSSARLHDLKFTFTPAGADDSVHSKAPLPRGGCLRSAQTGRVFEPILFFLFQKEKNGFNLPRKERVLCKTGSANRTAIASEEASSIPFPAGAAKTPYPQPSSSFPNCDRFTGSQFGHLEFYNAARDLDDGGHLTFYGYGL